MRPSPRKRRFRLRRLSLRSLLLLLLLQLLCIAAWLISWPKPPVQLSFVVPQEEVQPWQLVISQFETAHPNIQVLLVPEDPNKPSDATSRADFTTDEREAIYTLDIQVGAAKYDLVYMDIIWTPQFQDYLVDLTPWIERDAVDLSGFLESEVTAGKMGNQQYRLPMRSDVGLLYYRTDLLDSDQPPTGLVNLAQSIDQIKATDAKNQGYLWQGSSYEGLIANFVEVMSSFKGAFWINPQTQAVGLMEPATLDAARTLQQLIPQGISPNAVTDYTEQSSLEAFKGEQAAFLRGWPYFSAGIKALNRGDEVAIAPPFSFSSLPAKGCRGGWGFGIPRNATHPEEAWEAIKYFTSEPAQKTFVEASGYLPSRTALFQDPDIVSQYPQMPQLFNYLQQGSVFRPSLREYDRASAILQTALSEILRGQKSVDEAMRIAQEKTEALLKS